MTLKRKSSNFQWTPCQQASRGATWTTRTSWLWSEINTFRSTAEGAGPLGQPQPFRTESRSYGLTSIWLRRWSCHAIATMTVATEVIQWTPMPTSKRTTSPMKPAQPTKRGAATTESRALNRSSAQPAGGLETAAQWKITMSTQFLSTVHWSASSKWWTKSTREAQLAAACIPSRWSRTLAVFWTQPLQERSTMKFPWWAMGQLRMRGSEVQRIQCSL